MSYQSPLNIFISTIIIFLFFIAGCESNASNQNKTASNEMAALPKSDIEGAWELVWSKTNGKIDNPGKPMQLKIFCNGFFCYLMQSSSTSKWDEAGGGTYATVGKTYKETLMTIRYLAIFSIFAK